MNKDERCEVNSYKSLSNLCTTKWESQVTQGSTVAG